MKQDLNDYQELTTKEAKRVIGGSAEDFCAGAANYQTCIDFYNSEHCSNIGDPWMNDREATEEEEADLYPCY